MLRANREATVLCNAARTQVHGIVGLALPRGSDHRFDGRREDPKLAGKARDIGRRKQSELPEKCDPHPGLQTIEAKGLIVAYAPWITSQ